MLIALSGATTGKMGVFETDRPALLNQRVGRFRFLANDVLHSRFIPLLVEKIKEEVVRTAYGAAQPNISPKQIEDIQVCVPPFNEQKRIVEKTEELFSDLDAGIAALQRAKANLKRYRASVLKAAVEGKLTKEWRAKHPTKETASQLLDRILKERRQKWESDQLAKFAAANKQPPKNWQDKYVEPSPPNTTSLPTLPEGWCWVGLDQILTQLRNGYFQSPSEATTGTPILRINAVRPMRVDLDESKLLDVIDDSADDYFIENGDLLFTRYNGSIDLLGVAGLVRGCSQKILHPDKLIRVKLSIGEPLQSFIEAAANVGESRKHIVARARTTAGQTGISGPDVRQMPVPFAPLDEQALINKCLAEKLSLTGAAENQIEQGLQRSVRLRQSILKQAFEGKLVVQDANDESAAELIASFQADSSPKLTRVSSVKRPTSNNRSNTRRRGAVAAYVISFSDNRDKKKAETLGRTKLMKALYIMQTHEDIALQFHFQRYGAGPFDKAIYDLEDIAKENNWFTTQDRGDYGVTYHRSTDIEIVCQEAIEHLGERKAAVDRLLDHFAHLNMTQAELFATTYAAWNDLLLDKKEISNDSIIDEFYAWDESKQEFKRADIIKQIKWMQANGYVPTGKGQHTDKRTKETKLPSRKRRKSEA